MRRLACLLALSLAAPVLAQPSPPAVEAHQYRYDLMVSLKGAYPGGVGMDAEIQIDDHLRARLGVGFANANPYANTADPVGRALLLGAVGPQTLEAQGGVGLSVTNTTVTLTDRLGQYTGTVRQVAIIPHVYAGARSVLSLGANDPGRSPSAPRLSVRAGALLSAADPGRERPRIQPEVGFGFAF